MARKKIQPVDLTQTVSQLLEDYGAEASEALEEAMMDTAEDAVHQLRAVGRFAPNGHPSGAYSASWTMEPMRVSRYSSMWVIYNENHYRLAHLLEFGHAKQNGGRAPAYPHIAKVNTAVNVSLVQNFMRRIESK